MNTLEQMDVLASSMLRKIPEALEKGQQYGVDLFNRFIEYNIVLCILQIIASISLLLLALLVYKITKKKLGNNSLFYDDIYIIPFLIILFAFCIGIVMFPFAVYHLTILLYIPEIYVFDYLKT